MTTARLSPGVEILSSVSAIVALGDEWRRLEAYGGTPLLGHAWFLACARTLHAERDLRVVVVRRDQRLVAIAPLALHRTPPATWLTIMGANVLHEPGGLLYEDGHALALVVDALLALGQPLCLERLAFGAETARTLQQRTAARHHVLVRRTGRSCYLAFEGDWTAFESRMGAKSRAGLRTKARKAIAHGELAIDEHGRHLQAPDLPALLRRAFEIEASSWKGHAGSALLHQPQLRAFFEDYAASACAAGTLRLYFYRIGTRPVAMRLAVEYGRKLWFLKTGYDPAWSHVSPGVHLTMEIIRRGIDGGLAGCEFLGSDEPWQHAWPVQTHQYCSVLTYPRSFAGLCAGAATALAYVRGRGLRRTRHAAHGH